MKTEERRMGFFLFGARRHTPREDYVQLTHTLCDACHAVPPDRIYLCSLWSSNSLFFRHDHEKRTPPSTAFSPKRPRKLHFFCDLWITPLFAACKNALADLGAFSFNNDVSPVTSTPGAHPANFELDKDLLIWTITVHMHQPRRSMRVRHGAAIRPNFEVGGSHG